MSLRHQYDFFGTTLTGVGFSTGTVFTWCLPGIHLDYDYHQESTVSVDPYKYSFLAGPSFDRSGSVFIY